MHRFDRVVLLKLWVYVRFCCIVLHLHLRVGSLEVDWRVSPIIHICNRIMIGQGSWNSPYCGIIYPNCSCICLITCWGLVSLAFLSCFVIVLSVGTLEFTVDSHWELLNRSIELIAAHEFGGIFLKVSARSCSFLFFGEFVAVWTIWMVELDNLSLLLDWMR